MSIQRCVHSLAYIKRLLETSRNYMKIHSSLFSFSFFRKKWCSPFQIEIEICSKGKRARSRKNKNEKEARQKRREKRILDSDQSLNYWVGN